MQSQALGYNKMEVCRLGLRLGLRMNTFFDFSCFWHYLFNLPLLQQDIYINLPFFRIKAFLKK